MKKILPDSCPLSNQFVPWIVFYFKSTLVFLANIRSDTTDIGSNLSNRETFVDYGRIPEASSHKSQRRMEILTCG